MAYKVLVTTASGNSNSRALATIVVEFDTVGEAMSAIDKINNQPTIMNGYASQQALLLNG
jgi:hypothetical protein